MIKRLIGLLAALGIIALLVFVVLNRANYHSIIGAENSSAQAETLP